jgi:hypothetical protein
MGAGMGAGMGLPKLFRVGSRLVLEILPSVAATVIGGYLLAQLHFGRSTEPSAPPAAVVASSAEPTVGEDRAAMRQVLQARREKPEKPAQVQVPVQVRARTAAAPTTASIPATAPARPAAIPVGLDSISPHEPVARPLPPSRPNLTAVTTGPAAPPRPQQVQAGAEVQAEVQAEVYVPAPPPGLPTAPPRGMDAPTVIVPSVVTAAAPPAAAPTAPPVANMPPAVAYAPPAEPGHQGPVGVVFSTFSNFVGHAANATGHTVNWVIDLPGKAISVGGRAIGVDQPSPPPPARPFS